MDSELGRYVWARRLDQDLSLGQLARRLGPLAQRINKACRRIQPLEQRGEANEALLAAVTDALDLNPVEVRRLARLDADRRRAAWDRRMDQPCRPRLLVQTAPHWFTHFSRDLRAGSSGSPRPSGTPAAGCGGSTAGGIGRRWRGCCGAGG